MQHTGCEAGLLMLGDCELQYMHNEHDQGLSAVACCTPARAFFAQGTQANGVLPIYILLLSLVEVHPARHTCNSGCSLQS